MLIRVLNMKDITYIFITNQEGTAGYPEKPKLVWFTTSQISLALMTINQTQGITEQKLQTNSHPIVCLPLPDLQLIT